MRYNRPLKKCSVYGTTGKGFWCLVFFYIKLTVLFLTKISNMNLKQSQMGTLDEKATTEFSRALTWVFSRVLYFSK